MKTLRVRLQPKSGMNSFFRCGIKFSQDWQEVKVDDATAARLESEQMLEVEAVAPVKGKAAPREPDQGSDAPGAGDPADPPAPAPVRHEEAPEDKPAAPAKKGKK